MTEQEDAWSGLVRAATVGAREFFDSSGVVDTGTGTFRIAVSHAETVLVDARSANLEGLVADARDHRPGLSRISGQDVAIEIARRAAMSAAATRRGAAVPPWMLVRSLIADALTSSVVAVPVGGVVNSNVDGEGNSLPQRLGSSTVCGFLDLALEAAINELAKERALSGFHFSDDSWWTEDLMTAKGDPQVGSEILEGYEEGGTWPWFVFAFALPLSGVGAELVALRLTRAMMGALVLATHAPGTYWHDDPPWIPGGPSTTDAPMDPGGIDRGCSPAPQRIDGRAEHLTVASSALADSWGSRVIDIGSLAGTSAMTLLAAIGDSEAHEESPLHDAIVAGCTWAWTASLVGGPEGGALAREALRDIADIQRQAPAELPRLSVLLERGLQWQDADADLWPQQRSVRLAPGVLAPNPRDLDVDSVVDGSSSARIARDGMDAYVEAARWMNALQACTFGLAAWLDAVLPSE